MDCNGCKSVPYIVHEGIMTRFERVIRRLWIIIIILLVLFVGTNIAWIIYENQFEDVVTYSQEVEQDADGNGNNTFVGGDYNGETTGKDNSN